MLKRYIGRPNDETGRMDKEINVYNMLDKLSVIYERVDHKPAMTMEVCKDIEQSLEAKICKNLFLCNRQGTKFYLLMMDKDKKFKTKELSSQINSARLSFASDEDMMKYLNITPGSVSVMGLLNDVNHDVCLLLDEDILKEEYIGCHPCINTSSIRLKTKDLLDKVLPYLEYTPTFVKLLGE